MIRDNLRPEDNAIACVGRESRVAKEACSGAKEVELANQVMGINCGDTLLGEQDQIHTPAAEDVLNRR